MKQHIEIVTKVKTIKEIKTKSRKWMYSFSIPITKMSGETQLTEWIPVSILQEQQRLDLHKAKEVHFIGQLTVKESWGDYPQGISIFGFFIDPILNQVYRQRKTRKNTPEDAPQARGSPPEVSRQASNAKNGSDFPEQSESIPF